MTSMLTAAIQLDRSPTRCRLARNKNRAGIPSILFHGHISSLSKARKDDLICKGQQLVDHACTNVRNEFKSILGKEGLDDALVAIILASAAELKRMPALLPTCW
jgi:hypothetical protein